MNDTHAAQMVQALQDIAKDIQQIRTLLRYIMEYQSQIAQKTTKPD